MQTDENNFDGSGLIPAADAARSSGLNRDYVARLARTGKIAGHQIDGVWYVSETSLKDFLHHQARTMADRRVQLARERKREYLRAATSGAAASSVVVASEHTNDISAFDAKKKLAAAVLKKMPVSAMQTTPAYAVAPVMDFVHRASALITAIALVFGTYAFADWDVVGPMMANAHERARLVVAHTGAVTEVASDPSQLAAVALSFPDLLGSLAKKVNASVNAFVFEVVFSNATPSEPGSVLVPEGPDHPSVPTRPVDEAAAPVPITQMPTASPATSPLRYEPGRSATSNPPTPVTGVTQAYLDQSLLSLRSEFLGRLFAMENANSTSFRTATADDTYDESAVAITGGTISGVTITGGSVTATAFSGTLPIANGGTGLSTYATGDIVYANAADSLARLAAGSNGQVLKLAGGVPTWSSDLQGSGGAGAWATSSDDLLISPSDTTDVVVIGTNATSTTGNIFEVVGNALFRGSLTSYFNLTAPRFTATSSVASSFPFASTTALSATTLCLSSDCRTSWPTGEFSTTSADYWQTQRNFFSTTSATHFSSLGLAFSTTSSDYWKTQNNFFATSSADYWKTANNFFSTTSASYFSSLGLAFSTTSSDAWKAERNFFSTTSIAYYNSVTDLFSTTSAQYFTHSSTTIPKTYTANTYTGLQTFSSASTTNLSASYASSTLYFGAGLANCASENMLTWTDGRFGCEADTSGGGASFSYLFPSDATTTRLTFSGGLLSLASTTIGNGSQTGGLTISGGATTSGNILGQGTLVISGATTLNGTLTATGGLSTLSNLLLTGSTTLQNFTFAHATGTAATTTSFAISGISSGSLLKTTTGGALVAAVAGTDYANFGYLFPSNATSTLLAFNGGLTAFASSTIGAGGQTTGLTINGGATTTGNAYIAGNLGIGTAAPAYKLDVSGSFNANTGSAYISVNGSTVATYGAVTNMYTNGVNTIAVQHGFELPTSIQGYNDGGYAVLLQKNGGNVGIGTTTPLAKLHIVDTTAASTTPLILTNFGYATSSTSVNLEFRTATSGPDIAVGTTTSKIGSILLQNFGGGKGALAFSVLNSGLLTEAARIDWTGYFGIGSTTPGRKLSVTDAVATAQQSIAYDGTRYTDLLTDSAGDFNVNPSGDDVRLNDDNLWVCTGGSCPSGTLSGTGNAIVETRLGVSTSTPVFPLTAFSSSESQLALSAGSGIALWAFRNAGGNLYVSTTTIAGTATTTLPAITIIGSTGFVGIGTTSPTQMFSVKDRLFVGANGASTLGTATSTFQGDIKITGKLDVSTIDPPYTIDGVKYATYVPSMTGVKEETVATVQLAYDPASGKYQRVIDFDALETGSDLWLFYQVTAFGEGWRDLVVQLTPSFDGTVFYTKDVAANTLTISGSRDGEVSMRLTAARYDTEKWPNLRPDQDGNTEGTHVISSKSKGGEATDAAQSASAATSLERLLSWLR